jgi:outer membrane receptor for ferrienterochelin and colicins
VPTLGANVRSVRTRGGIAVAVLLAWLAAGRAVFAQDEEEAIEKLDLQTLLKTPIDVWTATKTVQRTYDAPAVITTITREQIEVLGYRSIAELLAHQLGFYIVDDHISPNVAVRGTSGGLYADSSVIKVLIDGHSIAFAPTAGNWLGPELIPLAAVDRVEIIRGPASALYGADAFLGVVNIKTREGKSIDGGTARVAGGLVGTHPASDVDVALGTARGMVDVMLAYRRAQDDLSGLQLPASSPEPAIPVYNFGQRTAHGLDRQSQTAIARLTLRPRPGSEIGVFGYYSEMERGAEFGSLFQLANGYDQRGTFSENRISQWQMRAGLSVEQTLTEKLQLSLRGSYAQGAPKDDNRLEAGSDFYYVRRDFSFRGVDVDLHAVWTPMPPLHLVLGGSLLIDDEHLPSRLAIAKQPFQDVPVGGTIEADSIRQGQKTFINGGAYAQGTWDLRRDVLGLTGGLRVDQHNIYGRKLSGRAGLVFSPRADLHAKLLQGSAFKAPSPLLLYTVPSAPGDVRGNPDLKPQHVNTSEFQLVYEPWPALSLSTDVAYSLLRERTEFIQQEISKTARNVSQATTLSWENLIEVKPGDWVRGQLSFELQRTTQHTGSGDYVGDVIGSAASIYPNMMVHANLVVQPPRWPVRLAALASYIGRRRASGNNVLLNAGPYTLPPYVLLEANLSTAGFKLLRDSNQEVSFSLSGKNLLGATGPNPGFSGIDYPLAPRALFFQVNLGL